MLFGGSLLEGQAVVARKDIDGWLGRRVRRGDRGVVVSRPGLFNNRYTVNFTRAGRQVVRGRDIKPTRLVPGSDVHTGFRIGLFVVFVVLPAFEALRYLTLDGGSPGGLLAALPVAVTRQILGLLGAVGLPVLVLVTAGLLMWRRIRR